MVATTEYKPSFIVNAYEGKEKEFHQLVRSDPVAFCHLVTSFKPHKAQAEFLLSKPEQGHKSLLTFGRQFGKTTIVAKLISWKLFAERDFVCYVLAPSGDQARHLWQKVVDEYERSQYLQKYTESNVRGNTFSVGGKRWGSKVTWLKTGLTAENTRGKTANLVCFDEIASFLYPHEVTGTVEPFCASGGGIVYLSSPGEIGSFMHQRYEDWKQQQKLATEEGRDPVHRVFECTWEDTHHLSKTFVMEQKRQCERDGRLWFFEREYLGKWTKTEGAFFNADDVRQCQVQQPLRGGPKDTWIYSLDPGLDKSPAVLLLARWAGAKRRLEIVECLSLAREGNKYVDASTERVHDYADLLDLILSLRETKPIHRFYIDPGIEQTIGDILENRFQVSVERVRIGGYGPKLTALEDLSRSLSTQKIVWNSHQITDQLLRFSPKVSPLTNKYEFPDTDYDIIAALSQMNRYLGDRVETPFIVEAVKERKLW